jgi:hypothetical protein
VVVSVLLLLVTVFDRNLRSAPLDSEPTSEAQDALRDPQCADR